MFEGTRLTELQFANTTKVDAVFVPTSWHRMMLAEQGVERVWVIPEGVDKDTFHLGDIGRKTEFSNVEDPDEMLTFVSVGKLEKRKGMMVALDAINRARHSTDRPMRILASWFNPFIRLTTGENVWYRVVSQLLASRGFSPQSGSEMGSISRGERMVRFSSTTFSNLYVDLIPGPVATQEELVPIYQAGDFGLFPHYAEGWGLPLHESMACGVPPVTQCYSGPTEYLKEGCYLPVEGTTALAKDGNPKEGMPSFFHGDVGTWSQVKTDSLALAILRAVGMSKEERTAMGRLASQAALKFTWQRSAETTIKVLQEIGIL